MTLYDFLREHEAAKIEVSEYGRPLAMFNSQGIKDYETSIRADERRKVLEEVREITKTIEADDILARAESCDKNCCECDGCLTRILFEQLKGEQT